MRDTERIDKTMKLMEELWKSEKFKDLRFWQLVNILEYHAKALFKIEDVWNLEEEDWDKVIKSLIR